jgi:hypothetical protein
VPRRSASCRRRASNSSESLTVVRFMGMPAYYPARRRPGGHSSPERPLSLPSPTRCAPGESVLGVAVLQQPDLPSRLAGRGSQVSNWRM